MPVTERQWPPSLLDQDVFLLTRISMAARGEYTELLAQRGMSRWDVAVLAVLIDNGPTVQREIADQLGMHASDLVAILDGLLTSEFVARQRDPDDRRRYVITVTRAGRAAFSKARRVEQ